MQYKFNLQNGKLQIHYFGDIVDFFNNTILYTVIIYLHYSKQLMIQVIDFDIIMMFSCIIEKIFIRLIILFAIFINLNTINNNNHIIDNRIDNNNNNKCCNNNVYEMKRYGHNVTDIQLLRNKQSITTLLVLIIVNIVMIGCLFRDILQQPQHYGINNNVHMTLIVTTITIVLMIVNVLKAIQHYLMQQYYQYLPFTHIQNAQQEAISPIDFILHVFDNLAIVFYAIYQNINNQNHI